LRLTVPLAIFALSILNSQTTDPNKSGFPHDMTWFNVPKNPQPGVVHKGYHSAAMDKEVGYNIYLPPGYEAGSRRYPVVYWLHGRNNTEASDGYPIQYLAEGIASKTVPPMIMVYASGGSKTNYCDSYDGKYMADHLHQRADSLHRQKSPNDPIARWAGAAGDVHGRLWRDEAGS
jgi:hypothetical protein